MIEECKFIKVGDKTIMLQLVKGKQIATDCIFMDEVFANNYGNRINTKQFIKSKERLRHCHLSVTYPDLLKEQEQFTQAIEYYKAVVEKYNGCLITDHTDVWKELAIHFIESRKNTYMASVAMPSIIYKCSIR